MTLAKFIVGGKSIKQNNMKTTKFSEESKGNLTAKMQTKEVLLFCLKK